MTLPSRQRAAIFVGIHLLVSGVVATAFVRQFDQGWRAIAAHILILAEWDALLLVVLGTFVAFQTRRAGWVCRLLPAATFACQIYLYALNFVSNIFWGRNITGHLVAAFAPTVWSGREPFPVGATGIGLFAVGTMALMTGVSRWWGHALDDRLRSWLPQDPHGEGRPRKRFSTGFAAASIGCAVAIFAATMVWGIQQTDHLLWKRELVVSFFRPDGFAFEPTPRRHAAAERDAILRAAYPRQVTAARRKHVVLIIVDSLRADHMQVYGYQRPTTPFLSSLVQSGRMKRVGAAFSTCSESLCGITSTLSGREFRDISSRDFQIQDVLSDQGYQTWFLLSGNHRAWNGLRQFYRAHDGTFFDGSQTERYTMDDDRLVLEGLERVPPASPDRPTFFYLHLMSPHYLGVQFPESHFFTRSDDHVNPGLEPYKILERLNKPDRYDDKVRQADDIIRQLFEALAAKRYLDDAVVVVTADHGEGLGERHWAHGWDLYNEDIRIPLLLYDAPATTYKNLAFATQVDIAPTILDRLGLPIPASWQGRSLLAPTVKRFSVHQTYFLPNRFAVLYRADHALFKYIATPQDGKEELYDLTHDLGEGHNLAPDQSALVALLRDKLRTYLTDEP
jgi:Sulfatase